MQQSPILIVDDHANIREIIRFAVEKEGFTAKEATNGKEAIEFAKRDSPCLIVLDISMPELDGLSACREIRKTSNVPILFVSSRDEEIDRILGLELGGDDYVTKPFSPRELVARIKVILRRGVASEEISKDPAQTLQAGHLKLDLNRCEATWQSTPVILTATEFSMLKAMLRWPGKVWSRQELMDHAWDMATHVSDRTVDTHIRRLRQKFSAIGGEPIETVHGFGYKLSVSESKS